MTIDTDFHSHIVGSSALQMVQSAQKKGIRVLGISEHVFQMNEARAPLEHMKLEGPMLPFASYIKTVHTIAQDMQFDARLGLEVDLLPEKNDLIQASLQGYPWDFLIGSVHEVDGYMFEASDTMTQAQGEALWLRYFELLRSAVKSDYFDVISHPVRMRSKNPHLPPTLDDELERLAALATSHNVALEINGYDMVVYPNVVRRLVKACVLHQTPISVGSDAHRPRQIAQSHQPTEVILREAGISKVRIWKQRIAEEYEI